MNLKNMFEMQKTLDDHIMEEHPELKGQDNLDWKVLALLVEVGECANEWRGFKKWSKDQKPRTQKSRAPYMDLDDADFYNPLLEEYVDGFHFVLSIGLELNYQNPIYIPIGIYPKETTDYLIELYNKISELNLLQTFHKGEKIVMDAYQDVFDSYLHLGHRLGFTWDQIEEAYMAKNAINHKRQEQGY